MFVTIHGYSDVYVLIATFIESKLDISTIKKTYHIHVPSSPSGSFTHSSYVGRSHNITI